MYFNRLGSGYIWILFILFFTATCGQPKLTSKWRSHEVIIDGKDGDWKDARVHIESAGVTVGVLNDTENFYLTLSVIERNFQEQVLRRGFIIWFDYKGGKRKNFGVRFPLGMPELLLNDLENRFSEPGFGGAGGFGGRGGYADRDSYGNRGSYGGRGNYGNYGDQGLGWEKAMDPGQVEELFEQLMEGAEMELLGSTPNDRLRVPLATSEEILMQVVYVNGRLTYELKVPLARVTHPSKKNKPIGVGFEIPVADLRALRQAQMARAAGGELDGNRPNALGGATGLGTGRDGYTDDSRYRYNRRRSRRMPTETFELWTKVRLAQKDDS